MKIRKYTERSVLNDTWFYTEKTVPEQFCTPRLIMKSGGRKNRKTKKKTRAKNKSTQKEEMSDVRWGKITIYLLLFCNSFVCTWILHNYGIR